LLSVGRRSDGNMRATDQRVPEIGEEHNLHGIEWPTLAARAIYAIDSLYAVAPVGLARAAPLLGTPIGAP
jgi:hypothetical protein